MKKAAKATRTSKRGKLPPRAEWDFSKVTRKDSAVVCMREYAKECLRRLRDDEKLSLFAKELADQFGKSSAVQPADLMQAVRRGLEKRAAALVPRNETAPTPLQAIDPDNAQIAPGSQVACFAIDWRATNAEIRSAFNDWLTKQSKGHTQAWKWHGAWEGTLSSVLAYEKGGTPHDYIDSAEAALSVMQPADGSALEAALIAAQRRMRGDSKGRGDARRALLTDLAIYRIHRAGCGGEVMAKALGNSRLKFYDAPLVRRALAGADARIWKTVCDAFTCESLSARLKAFCAEHADRSAFVHPAFRQT